MELNNMGLGDDLKCSFCSISFWTIPGWYSGLTLIAVLRHHSQHPIWLRRPFGLLGIEPMSVAWKANTIPALLSLATKNSVLKTENSVAKHMLFN